MLAGFFFDDSLFEAAFKEGPISYTSQRKKSMTKANIEPIASAWIWETSGDILNLAEFMALPNATKLVEDGVLVPLYKLASCSEALSPLSPEDWKELAKEGVALVSRQSGAGPECCGSSIVSDLVTFGKKVAHEIQTRTNVLVELSSVEVRNI